MTLSAEDRWLLRLEPDELADLLLDLDEREAAQIAAHLERLADVDAQPSLAVWDADETYSEWIAACLPRYFPVPLAEHHRSMWEWAWRLGPGRLVDPLVGVLARGGAKSTTAEGIVVASGARHARRFALYVCDTQEQANDHVTNIATMLESPTISDRYPDLADRQVGKFGQVRAWRQSRLRTASGFTVHALGVDAAVRGIKVEDARPDLIVLDDIDAEDDSPHEANRKIETITTAILQAGSSDVAVLAVQNLIHPDSVFAQIVDGRAEMLRNRTLVGPIPAVRGAAYEQRDDGGWLLVGGEPTWVGQSLTVCQAQIDLVGISAFRKEAQHEVTQRPGGMYSEVSYSYIDLDDMPPLDVVTVWVDPAVTDKDSSDSQAVQVDGRADKVIYRLWSWEQRTSPLEAVKLAIRQAIRWGATTVGIETDQGGDTWHSVYRDALVELALDESDPLPLDALATRRAGITEFVARAPTMLDEKAGSGHGGTKVERSSRMLADYERGASTPIVHVLNDEHTHEKLEAALFRFPKTKPFDLADAAFWSWRYLRIGEGRMEVPQGRMPTGAQSVTGRGAGTRVPTGAASMTGARRQGGVSFGGRR